MIRKILSLTLFSLALAACALQTDSAENVDSKGDKLVNYWSTIYYPFQGLCLDAWAFEGTAPTELDVFTCNGLQNQQFYYNSSTHQIADWNGLCLENSYADGYLVNGWPCNANGTQRWAIDHNRHQLINQQNGKCLRAAWYTKTPWLRGSGSAIFLAGCNDPEWEKYSVWWGLDP